MTADSYSAFNAMIDLVAAPGKALDNIREHTRWFWWPLLISILMGGGMLVYYYNWVDFNWLVEETIRQTPPDRRAEGAEAIRAFMDPGRTQMIGLVSVVVMTFVIYTLQATWLHLANKLTTGAAIGFGQWFSFTAWTAFVGVFGALAAIIAMLIADSNQASLEKLLVFSMNSLFMHVGPESPWYRWASSLTLLNIWTLVLMSIGYARWTGASISKSATVAVLPWLLIFGIWAARI